MKKITLIVALLSISIYAGAQTLSPKVTASGGGYATSVPATLSWTIGETNINTLQSGDIILTQGFEQPYSPVALSLKMFIQGYYLGNGSMAQVLLNEGADNNPNSANVDTVTVSLVVPTDGTHVQTTKGILQTNGSLPVTFPGAVVGNSYYVYLQHRNSLKTSSSSPVTLNTMNSYDFSAAANKAYGNIMAEVDTANGGTWAIYTGDIDQNGYIDPYDFSPYDLDNSLQLSGEYMDAQGYSTDLNGDGYVDPYDFPVYDSNNSMQISVNVPW